MWALIEQVLNERVITIQKWWSPALGECCRWNRAPPKRYAEVLTPSISQCDLIWNQGFYRGHQVKTRSLGWIVIQYDSHPYKSRTLGHRDRHPGKPPCSEDGRYWGDTCTSQERPKFASKSPAAGKRHGTDSPSEGNHPPTPDFRLLASRLGDNKFCY